MSDAVFSSSSTIRIVFLSDGFMALFGLFIGDQAFPDAEFQKRSLHVAFYLRVQFPMSEAADQVVVDHPGGL